MGTRPDMRAKIITQFFSKSAPRPKITQLMQIVPRSDWHSLWRNFVFTPKVFVIESEKEITKNVFQLREEILDRREIAFERH
jgi:hypothetical protein